MTTTPSTEPDGLACQHLKVARMKYDDGYLCVDEPFCHERFFSLAYLAQRLTEDDVMEAARGAICAESPELPIHSNVFETALARAALLAAAAVVGGAK